MFARFVVTGARPRDITVRVMVINVVIVGRFIAGARRATGRASRKR
jgi:hypothetical protein